MEFLQRLSEIVIARVQFRIYDQKLLSQYQTLFDTDYLSTSEIQAAYTALLQEKNQGTKKYRELLTLCGNTEAARWLLELCLTALLYPEFLQFCVDCWNGITLDVVSTFLSEEASYLELKKTAQCAQRILKCDKKAALFLRYQFWADARILDFFMDETSICEELKDCGAELFSPEEAAGELFIGAQVQAQLESDLKSDRIPCIQIAGNPGCGKRFLLKRACKALTRQIVMADMEKFVEKEPKELAFYTKLLIREALLLKCGLCFYGVIPENLKTVVEMLVEPGLRQDIRIILCTTLDTELIAMLDAPVEKVTVASYGRNERIALWEGFTKELGIAEQVDCVIAGTKFKLSAKEIKKAAERIARNAPSGVIRESEISTVCEEVLLNPSCGSIKRIHVQYTLDDLKLWPEQKQILKNICAHVWHRHKVYDDWNMDSRYAYGKNVSALFYGPPGTGKTMAVHVLANMLNLPLYRIDLSQVVDKYIGETEKRLEEIFDAAEKNNTVLFFDEADSIFGKRSEVNEAKDKYANTEVSYILQRIEQYEGIVILATNYRKNIDEAFMRRIRYVVEFSLPDKELRKELWKTSFSKEIPTKDLDFDYLAEQFELAGGAIKNIVLNASFLAASHNRPVEMIDVLCSVRDENVKLGKVMLSRDFGLYAALMEETEQKD